MEIQKKPSLKIKENLGRGKAYLSKGENIKGIFYICESLQMFLKENLIGQEKIEIEYLIGEAIQLIKTIPSLGPYLPKNISFDKNNVKKLYITLVNVLKNIIKNLQSEKKEEEISITELKKRKILDKIQKHLSEKNVKEATKIAESMLKKEHVDVEYFLNVADKFYETQNYKEAIFFAKKILEKDPKNQKAFKIVLNSYLGLKEYEKVEEYYQKALKEFGEHPNIYFNLSRLYIKWGKKEKAREFLKKALQLDPSNKLYKKMLTELTK